MKNAHFKDTEEENTYLQTRMHAKKDTTHRTKEIRKNTDKKDTFKVTQKVL